jgi:pseudouridine kinase
MAMIAVVGAANVDIGGFSSCTLVGGDSNPGRIRTSLGGVGRNIALNLAHLGCGVELITALGGDVYADRIRDDCARRGVGLTYAMSFPDAFTSTYLFIADERGDMALAINDMSIHERLTASALLPALPWLNQMDLVVIDANLPREAIEMLASELRVPIIADAVSAAKADKLRGVLRHLDALKPNRVEAELLTGIRVTDAASARAAARALLDTGLRRVFLTLGAQGVVCADRDEMLMLAADSVRPVNATGAGDAFTAALAWATVRKESLRETALAGMAAASIAMESMETVNENLSAELLQARITQIGRIIG